MWMCYVLNLVQVVEDVLSGKIEGKPYKTDEPPVQKKRVKVDIWRWFILFHIKPSSLNFCYLFETTPVLVYILQIFHQCLSQAPRIWEMFCRQLSSLWSFLRVSSSNYCQIVWHIILRYYNNALTESSCDNISRHCIGWNEACSHRVLLAVLWPL